MTHTILFSARSELWPEYQPVLEAAFAARGMDVRLVQEADPAEVDFLAVEEIDGQLWQNVMIRDQDGGLHILEYEMIRQGEDWKMVGN